MSSTDHGAIDVTLPRSRVLLVILLAACFVGLNGLDLRADQRSRVIECLGGDVGIVAVIDLPGTSASSVTDLLEDNRVKVYFQSADADQVAQVRKLAAESGLLGDRIFVGSGSPGSIQLANNVADCILVAPSAANKVAERELLRALRPKGTAIIGDRIIIKPLPEGYEDWTHPYHGPDNNPRSRDQLARGEFRTQFIGLPKFSPMPEQTVAAGGRLFKALGHIAHRSNQNAHLNTLLCINAYNGMILWKRPLPEGFMIHRNTMIATEDALYMGDHESCKVIDALTGKVREQITVPEQLVDGPVWKWMAMRDGILYGLVGNKEVKISTQRSTQRGLGHWPWGMWEGHDYKDPRLSFGYGRTLVAIDLKTKKIKWHFRSETFMDARAVAMNSSHIIAYSPGQALTAIDCATGKMTWRQGKGEALDAIGPNQRAQLYVTGYATTCYMKCNDDYLFFAGPQRKQMAVLSATTGDLAWTHRDGNLQIVLCDDAIYAAGPKSTGVRLDYKTGKKLSDLPTRRACTRATAGVDSVFYRASGGTIRVLTGSRIGQAQHIAAMRPPCQDGVLISNGHLYWGPWMCGCQLSLYGNIALGPAGADTFATDASLYKTALVSHGDAKVEPLDVKPNDWPAFRAGNARADFVTAPLPRAIKAGWTARISSKLTPTAPVAAGDMVFVADRSGAVQAFGADGKAIWKNYTAGPIYFAPAIAADRVFVGSADGSVYAFAARSGELLWTFRVAPAVRRILVFGELISRWPVAGGVVVRDNTVYAAAGIVDYDGTYVVALDAATGKLKAHNSTSGRLEPKVNAGISLQGNLSIVGNELRFLGGGVYQTARYNLKTLACLNEPKNQLNAGYRTAFYPFYPQYGKYVSLQASCPDGVLCHAASYEGNFFGNLALLAAPPNGQRVASSEEARRTMRMRGQLSRGKRLWQDARNRRFTSFIASNDILIATGHTAKHEDKPFIMAVNVKDGSTIWRHDLPADTVKGGIAIDHARRIFVSLEDGRLLCFLPDKASEAQAEKQTIVPPNETSIEFIADRSMKLYAKGGKEGRFPTQEVDDALGPFEGKGVYFRQRGGQDTEVDYLINSAKPVRQIHYRGAATFRMTMRIVDLDGNIAYSTSGPFNKGNVYSEHTINVPAQAGRRFILRFHNEASTWFYIERLTLR